jgi:hypothetical protein
MRQSLGQGLNGRVLRPGKEGQYSIKGKAPVER